MSTTPPTPKGPNGQYEGTLTSNVEGEGELRMVTVVKKPADIPLVQPKTVAEDAQTPLPALMQEKMKKMEVAVKRQPKSLFTETQKRAIYKAIEQDKSLVKIRRVWGWGERPAGSKIKRVSKKAPTELEQKLDLEFSVIIDDNREPIALFRGKGFAVGTGATGQVKFGQRLSDGKWVAVKIQKYDLSEINTLKNEIIFLQNQLERKKIKLAEEEKRLKELKEKEPSLTAAEEAAMLREIYMIQLNINGINVDITGTELRLRTQEQQYQFIKDSKMSESKITSEANVQSGSASRMSADSEKFYSVQTLFEGHELSHHVLQRGFKGYVSDNRERLQMGLLALKALQGLHHKNIVHGDIKLENMIYLRDPAGQNSAIQIIDFGQSVKVDGEKPVKSAWPGTGIYSAPEVRKDGVKTYSLVSKASDIHAMGKLFEFMFKDYKFKGGVVSFALDPYIAQDVQGLFKLMQMPDPKYRPTVDAVIREMERIIQKYDQKPKMGHP